MVMVGVTNDGISTRVREERERSRILKSLR